MNGIKQMKQICWNDNTDGMKWHKQLQTATQRITQPISDIFWQHLEVHLVQHDILWPIEGFRICLKSGNREKLRIVVTEPRLTR